MFGGPRVYGWPGAGAGGGFHCARTLERGHGAGAGGGISPAGDWLLHLHPPTSFVRCYTEPRMVARSPVPWLVYWCRVAAMMA